MKKIIYVFCAILILVFLAAPISASNIDGSMTCYFFEEVYPGLYALYTDDTSDIIVDYVITDEFYLELDKIYQDYISISSYESDFFDFLIEHEFLDFLNDNLNLKNIIKVYQKSKALNDVIYQFEQYKKQAALLNESITPEGFANHLNYHYPVLYEFYITSEHSIYAEMYSAGASSSSSNESSGSSGDNSKTHYGESHTNTSHEITDSDCCYNPGYNDGLLDGGDAFQKSEQYQTIINENKTEAVNNYLQSEEFLNSLEVLKTESSESAIKNYLTGEDYKGAIDSAYAIGSENGYNEAYEDAASDVYEMGRMEGFNDFRNSQECQNALSSAYERGWRNGENYASENAINPGGVIILIVLLIAGVGTLIILTKFERKKRGK